MFSYNLIKVLKFVNKVIYLNDIKTEVKNAKVVKKKNN